MRMDQVIILIGEATGGESSGIGDPVAVDRRRETFAQMNSIRQSEFYQAAAAGMKPEITFTIYKDEYAGEKKLEHDGTVYQIIRTFAKEKKFLEIVCSGLVNEVS